MVLDGKDYNPATFGNPKSKEYKDMKKEFRDKVGLYSQCRHIIHATDRVAYTAVQDRVSRSIVHVNMRMFQAT